MKNGLNIDKKGTIQYLLNGLLHRVDGPAEEYANGDKFWWLNNEMHRVDGPASEWADGLTEWYLHGKKHREDGPAEISTNGSKFWYIHGEMHRVDGPAAEWANGNILWFQHGKLHREGDYAVIWAAEGNKQWYLHGKQLIHPDEFETMEEWFCKLNADEKYSLQWISDINGLISFINNPTNKQLRLHAMRWKI